MKAVCIHNNGRELFATIGKTYEIVGSGIFSHNNQPYYAFIDNRGKVIKTININFKPLSEVRKEKLLKLYER